QLSDDLAMVQTVDFFTPIVDDPYLYGEIAATNSLSDVFAMGGKPVTAMNIVGMPTDILSLEIIHEILRGGADKVKEANCALAGGHSIKNPEPIYGLSVTGLVNPHRMITNAGAEAGDVLVLTKPLGTGILTTGIKRGLAEGAIVIEAVSLMSRLNTPGQRLAEEGLVKCATDVTGFGLLGHLISLCRSSGTRAVIHSQDTPAISSEIIRLIEEEECVPGGTKQNLQTAEKDTSFGPQVSQAMKYLLADAQTSGGLLCCVPEANLSRVMEILEEEETLSNAVVGHITPAGEPDEKLVSVV
ncbi:MAG: selenide, water dikinase SelD, partial [Verrucomicrobiota bacterium]